MTSCDPFGSDTFAYTPDVAGRLGSINITRDENGQAERLNGILKQEYGVGDADG